MKPLVLLLFLALIPMAEVGAQATGQISGVVTDASGTPLSGAQVSVGGTGRGTVSGADGRFTITAVPAGSHLLRASRLGFTERTQSVAVVAGQTATVTLQMTAQAVELEEIVAVGYGTQRRQDVTGAVGSVTAEQVRQIPTPSVGEALKGRVPGVDIQTTAFKPGDQPTIRIRGVRSMRASNEPLVVVDGVAIAGGLGDINPRSIQSIDVLKDASATAVYGSRGANGVVLITTHKGRAGQDRITYDASYGLQDIHNLVEVYDGPGYAQYKREAFRTAGRYKCPVEELQCEAGDRDLFTAEELSGVQNGVSVNYPSLIARTGSIQNHQLGITSGNEKTRFAIGASFLDEKGVTLGQGFVRRGATFSVDHTRGRFQAGLSGNVSNSLQNLGRGDGLWGGAMQINPLGAPYDADGNLVGTPIPDVQAWNPLLDAANWKRDDLRTRSFGNAFGQFELFDGVSLRTTFGADMLFLRRGEFRGALTQPNRGSSNNAWVEREQTFNYVSTTALQIERQLTTAQRVNATLLYEIQNERFDRSRGDVQNLPYEHQVYHNLGTAALVTGVTSRFQEWLLQSFMGRANYSLHDRYYLTLTGRQDCSSRLAPDNKCAFFPSAALKWRVSDEGLMQNQSLFSDLSLRASYGRTGNTSIDPYQTQGGLSRTTYSFGGVGAFGFRPGTLANPELEWEKTDQYDVGIEFGLLDHRISGSADFFVQNTSDLLLLRQLPEFSGFGSILENIGETRNTGLELLLSTVNVADFHGLSWTTDLNFSTIKNEIVSLYGGKADDVGNRWFVGKPINVFYEYEFDGIWQLGQEAEATKYQQKVGAIRVKDRNGDGRINDQDRTIIGRHNNFPKWTGSLSNRFQLGGFELSGLVTARWGYTLNSSIYPGALAGRYNNVVVNYWTPRNPSNEYPRPNVDQEFPQYQEALRLRDGSHWRIRNITLGYEVPSALTGRLGENSSLRLYAQAQDPYVSTKFEGFDPEGGEDIGTPSYRTLLIGASVGF